ncbi:MAG: hypothetical protein M0R03_19810 [Novosphingobium sp.]|nr:hypothetical protein [Novosphingobium sp.]
MDLKQAMKGKIIKGNLNGEIISEQWINVNDALLIAEKYAHYISSQLEPQVIHTVADNVYADIKGNIKTIELNTNAVIVHLRPSYDNEGNKYYQKIVTITMIDPEMKEVLREEALKILREYK